MPVGKSLDVPMSSLDSSVGELFRLPVMSLATAGPEGEPHAAAVYFVALSGETVTPQAGWGLFFFSDPASTHARDLTHHPTAAATISAESQGWEDIRGLQMRGSVRPVESGMQWDRAWASYVEKFPFAGQLKTVVAQNRMFVFSPSWIRLIDNRQRFGFKQEWTF